MANEKWLPVVGYEGYYEVSDMGRVRSLDRTICDAWGRHRRLKGQLLVANPLGTPPYRSVSIRRHTRRVHDLVMQAFCGRRPVGCTDIRHLNGDHLDCRLENLAYGTKSENQIDSVRHGTHPYAKRTECKYGHEFTPENTRKWRRMRICRICYRERRRDMRRRRQERDCISEAAKRGVVGSEFIGEVSGA